MGFYGILKAQCEGKTCNNLKGKQLEHFEHLSLIAMGLFVWYFDFESNWSILYSVCLCHLNFGLQKYSTNNHKHQQCPDTDKKPQSRFAFSFQSWSVLQTLPSNIGIATHCTANTCTQFTLSNTVFCNAFKFRVLLVLSQITKKRVVQNHVKTLATLHANGVFDLWFEFLQWNFPLRICMTPSHLCGQKTAWQQSKRFQHSMIYVWEVIMNPSHFSSIDSFDPSLFSGNLRNIIYFMDFYDTVMFMGTKLAVFQNHRKRLQESHLMQGA